MKRMMVLVLALILSIGVGAAASDVTISRDLDATLPLLDTIVLTIGVEGEIPYDAEDPDTFFCALYLLGVNWPEVSDRITMEGGDVVVPIDVMNAIAAALGQDEIPEIPEYWQASIALDEAGGAYRLGGSDRGESHSRVDSYEVTEAGVAAVVGLYGIDDDGGDELVGVVKFLLAKNDEEDALFPYRLVSVQ